MVTCTSGSVGAALVGCVSILCLPPVFVQRRTGREGGQNCDGTTSRSYQVTAPQPGQPGAATRTGRQIKRKARGRLKNGSHQVGSRPTSILAVEKVPVARFQAILHLAKSLRQGGAPQAKPARTLLTEPEAEFFNKLGSLRKMGCLGAGPESWRC